MAHLVILAVLVMVEKAQFYIALDDAVEMSAIYVDEFVMR